MAHALIIAIARLTKVPNYKAYNPSRGTTPIAINWNQLTKWRGVPELQRFQDHFPEYRIVVYGGLHCKDIIFEVKVASERRVNLLFNDVTRHFHDIANLTGAMSKQYKCAGCSNSCDSGVTN